MTMTRVDGANLVVVDGSNIATEGRSTPSLSQLNDAVLAFTDEHPDVTVTVVVDATFGHRIDKSEVNAFDEAVAHNELVAPPAGAVGRGDAFVLSIANKVGARILSNDSFQEFHGKYPWLFDEGRLIGGKPVPFVGWVFVERLPVKGPVSRRARSAGGGAPVGRRTVSKMASLPMPVPTAPPPGPAASGRRGAAPADAEADAAVAEAAPAPAAAGSRSSRGRKRSAAASTNAAPAEAATPRMQGSDSSTQKVNELMPFLEFIQIHPVGSAVDGVVDTYSSHGAYVMIGDVRGYVPLRLLADPPPRSAREVLKLGDTVRLEVVSFAPARCSIDLRPAPSVEASDAAPATPAPAKRRGRSSTKQTSEAPTPEVTTPADVTRVEDAVEPVRETKRAKKAAAADAVAPPTEPATARQRTRAARVASETETQTETPPPSKRAAKSAAKKVAPAETPSKQAAAASDAPAKKASAAKKAPAAAKSPPKKAPAKKSPAAEAAPAPAKSAAKKSTAAAKKSPAKKSSAAEKSPAKTSAAKKSPAKKSAASDPGAGGGASTRIPGREIERARSILLVEMGDGAGVSA